MVDQYSALLSKDGVITREIEYGGNTKEELLEMLTRNNISLNEYAKVLFSRIWSKLHQKEKKETSLS